MHPKISLAQRLWACLPGALLFLAGPSAAEEVDFSCMSERVRGMPQMSDRYKEYDVILHNRCPGEVYWTLCIERIDPASQAVVETHTPSGLIQPEAKSRVNLQLTKGPESMVPHRRFQELYVSAGYTLDPPARARCVAAECERYKREWRVQLAEHRASWLAEEQALAARLKAECPGSAWGKTPEDEACEAAVRDAAQPELRRFAVDEERLLEKLRTAGGPGCALHAGDPVAR